MAMTGLEKLFVNRQKKAQANIERLGSRLGDLDIASIQDVIEIGCGTGALSAYLSRERGMNVHGLDLDPGQIQIARELHGQGDLLRFCVGDATELAFEDLSFDLVVSQDVFHHIAAWPRAVSEIARVLRSGGHLVWMDMVFPRVIKALFRPLAKNHGLYTLDDLELAFKAHGLEVRVHERLFHGLSAYHHFVLQKV